MRLGWMQVAFADDLDTDVHPVDVGDRALVAVRTELGHRVFDGRCPHRGAHLGHGGTVDGDVLVCPFHGHRVHLGAADRAGFCIQEHRAVRASAGLFVLMGGSPDTGLADRLSELDRTHHVRSAFAQEVAVPPEYVIENVFDADHFANVHGVERRPVLNAEESPTGSLKVTGTLELARRNKWQDTAAPGATDEVPDAAAGFVAEVFSPTVVVTALGHADDAPVVITSATPRRDGGCLARVSVALPRHRDTGAPTVRELSSLVSGSRTAFQQDAVVWDHLDTTVTPQYVASDALVVTYREFCQRFLAAG